MFTCGQAQDEMAFGTGREVLDALEDVSGSPLGNLARIILNDQTHFQLVAIYAEDPERWTLS